MYKIQSYQRQIFLAHRYKKKTTGRWTNILEKSFYLHIEYLGKKTFIKTKKRKNEKNINKKVRR